MVAPTGKRISLHAETNSVMERRQQRLTESGRTDPLAHLASLPRWWRWRRWPARRSLPNGRARASTSSTSPPPPNCGRARAKARGVDITGETCPHYMMLGEADYARCRGVIRVNPPVRESANDEPLWAALIDGTIDMIATDHAPHTPEEKTRADIWAVDCGFPGVETQMPLMLTEVAAGPLFHLRLCALERGQSGQGVGSLSPQGRDPARRRCRFRLRRSRPRLDAARRRSPVALEDLSLGRQAVVGLPRHTMVRAAS